MMKIGIPKEIKNNENRVGMTPAGVAELIRHGHQVLVQHTAGVGSGFNDAAYESVGAKIMPSIEEVYAAADMIVKVKEPIEPEYPLIRKDQVVFTYFHFACDKPLTDAMIKSHAVCIAYETVEKADHSLPLLIPMSEVAGRMAAQNGAYYLQKTKGGKGKLMAGAPGVMPAKVLVLGGGTVGEAAARIAAGMGADVIITDISLPKLKQLAAYMPPNVHTLYSSEHNIRKQLHDVDVVIGSVLVPGDAAPHLITRDMLGLMEPGTVLVDVAIDQGGCFETSHAQRSYVYYRRHIALRSGQYTGRSSQYVDHSTNECYAQICHPTGRQGLETGLQRRSGTHERRKHGRRQDNLRGRGQGLGTGIHTACFVREIYKGRLHNCLSPTVLLR